jgi:transcriptional regulator with XRE-family HTH domain
MKKNTEKIEYFSKNFGKNIKTLRKISGLLGDDFAKAIGTSRPNLLRIENGVAKGVSLLTLQKLSKVTSLDKLFTCKLTSDAKFGG